MDLYTRSTHDSIPVPLVLYLLHIYIASNFEQLEPLSTGTICCCTFSDIFNQEWMVVLVVNVPLYVKCACFTTVVVSGFNYFSSCLCALFHSVIVKLDLVA